MRTVKIGPQVILGTGPVDLTAIDELIKVGKQEKVVMAKLKYLRRKHNK